MRPASANFRFGSILPFGVLAGSGPSLTPIRLAEIEAENSGGITVEVAGDP
jgi:hypothetical protein